MELRRRRGPVPARLRGAPYPPRPEEVIAHLAGLVGADVTVTLEIEATIPDGAPENVVRAVTENARTLKFRSQAFEPD